MSLFWSSPQWHRYERAHGDEVGTRSNLLASATWKTRILDLRTDDPTLWRNVRKSYHPLINKLMHESGFRIDEVTGRQFIEACHPMQVRLEGTESRPIASWHAQVEWIGEGVGRCFVASLDNKPVAFAYVIVWDRWAYYGFARTEQQFAHHALQWHTIRTLKADGVHIYELGWQEEAYDRKGKRIEFFKSGWGGVDVPVVLSGCASCMEFAIRETTQDVIKCLHCGRSWAFEDTSASVLRI